MTREDVIGWLEFLSEQEHVKADGIVPCDTEIALGMAIEALKQPKWISVNEKLPNYSELQNEQVIVLLEDGNIFSTEFNEDAEGESIFGMWENKFAPGTLGFIDSEWVSLETVTHWMPIPELPEDGDRE